MGTSAERRRAARPPGPSGVDDPVLTSKITRPGVPGWVVPRPRIDALIANGARGPLTVVIGPPGAGKTMAIALWAAASPIPGALVWLTLDEFDNRPKVFWSYVVAALRRAGIAPPRAVPETGGGAAVDHGFLLRLASLLAAQDPPVIMVLDDLHLLTEPATVDGLAYVLKNAMPGLRLIAASRMDPLLALHRYRLAGQLTEIRADDLAFSVSDAGLLLAHHGVSLSDSALESLTARTEGWAAGMRLAALSLDGHPDPQQFVKELDADDSAVIGYLVDEVLSALPGSVREMLLRTSILDSVNADLASELADDPGAAGALSALAQANAFVRPLGQGWYRYHALFAAVLRLKVRSEHSARLPEWHRQAARWYQRNGRLVEAVRHAAESGDWPLAAEIVLDDFAVAQLIDPRGDQSLTDALRPMARNPACAQLKPLLVIAAIELGGTTGPPSQVTVAAAETILDSLPRDREIPARLAAALIWLALYRRAGNIEGTIAAAASAKALLGELPESLLEAHPVVRAQVLTGQGMAELGAGRLDAAASCFTAAAASTPESAYERADSLGFLALVEALRGRMRRAAELAGRAAETTHNISDGVAEHVTCAASIALAAAHLERGEFQQAHGQLKLADAALRASPEKLMEAVACLIAGRRHIAEGRAAAAAEMVSRARQAWSPPAWLERRLTLLESRACAAAGDIKAAVTAAELADPASKLDAAAALGYAYLAAGDHERARRALDGVREESAATAEARLQACLINARLSYGTSDSARGRRSLERALKLAEPEQLWLPFAMEGIWIRRVLRRDPDLAHAYREVLEPGLASPAAVAPPRQAVMGRPTPLIVERLSGRELEVLRRVAGMLSTAEIAAEMYISVNTVKTHLRSIYRKLSVAHRGEAVRRARQLELI